MFTMKLLAVRIGLAGLMLFATVSDARAQVYTVAKGEAVNATVDFQGTKITVTYDLISTDANALFKVSLHVSNGEGMAFTAQTVSGDVGDRVSVGRGRKIIWQSEADLENQEFKNFEFKVIATSSALRPISTPGAVSLTTPDLRGTWLGTYAGSATAELAIDRQDGGSFSGTVRVAMKRGDQPTELSVEGSVEKQLIALREVAVLKPGRQSRWNLGTGSGSLELEGQQMVGTGTDKKRALYTWSFTRQGTMPAATAAPTPTPAPPRATPMPRPATPIPTPTPAPAPTAAPTTDLSGRWEGTYADLPAELTLTTTARGTFSGTLLVTTSKGKAPTELSVEVLVRGEQVSLRETRLVSKGSAPSWNLGTATGILQPDNRLMSGSGKDSRASYSWSLMKK